MAPSNSLLIRAFSYQLIITTLIKCTNLNRYIFSSMHSNEKVYLFKSAHFNWKSATSPWLILQLTDLSIPENPVSDSAWHLRIAHAHCSVGGCRSRRMDLMGDAFVWGKHCLVCYELWKGLVITKNVLTLFQFIHAIDFC